MAFSLSLILVVAAFGGPLIIRQIQANREAKDKGAIKIKSKKTISYAQLSAPPPIEIERSAPPPLPKAKPTPVKAKRKFIKPVVKPDEEVAEEELIPTTDELKKIDPGTKDVEGEEGHFFTGDEDEEVEVVDAYAEVEIKEPEPPPPPPTPKKVEEVFVVVEVMPTFPGGEEALFDFLTSSLIYPSVARENGIEGVVVIQFIVEKDGSISDIKVLRPIGGGCSEEAIRVMKKMPKWIPGKQRNVPVRVKFTLPIRFKMQTN